MPCYLSCRLSRIVTQLRQTSGKDQFEWKLICEMSQYSAKLHLYIFKLSIHIYLHLLCLFLFIHIYFTILVCAILLVFLTLLVAEVHRIVQGPFPTLESSNFGWTHQHLIQFFKQGSASLEASSLVSRLFLLSTSLLSLYIDADRCWSMLFLYIGTHPASFVSRLVWAVSWWTVTLSHLVTRFKAWQW